MTEFLSPNEIAEDVFANMCADDKNAVLEDAPTAEDMIRYHHGVGRHIRNEFGLWDPANPYTDKVEGKFPDDVSHAILMKVWELVQAERP